MPRHLPSLLAILASSFVVATTADAAEKTYYHCQGGDIVRRVIIDVGDLSTGLPCEVVYWKDTEAPGVRRVLWNARSDAKFCEDKAAGLVKKLNSSGWQCDIRESSAASSVAPVQSEPQTAALQPDSQTLNTTVPALDAATVASQESAAVETVTPSTSTSVLPETQTTETQTAALTPSSAPLSPEANDQLQIVIEQNLSNLNQQVDGDFNAEVGQIGDLNADGLDDAVVLFKYQSSTADFTQFVAAYLYRDGSFHLAATKPVGGTERAVQSVEIESIVNGSILLKLNLNDAGQSEGRRAAMALKDGQLIEIE